MVGCMLEYACDPLKNKIIKGSGGPGIRTQVLKEITIARLPLHCLDLFVNILHNNDNITKQN